MVVIKDKSVINKIRKAKTRKGKRFLESREPQLIEQTKTAIFLRSANASQRCIDLIKDICLLKKPNSVFFNRKETYHPFEDITSIEFMCNKNNASLFMFANHSKKRPNNLIIGRTFDDHILDMVELGFDNYKSLNEFKIPKIAIGTKPIVLFSGQPFDVEHDYQRIKNLLVDFFSGPNIESIRLTGLEHVIQFVAFDGKVFMRSYKVLLKNSGTRLPRIELEEMGPRVDFTVRRTHLASQDLWKRSLRQPEVFKKKIVKNINRDKLGSTLGRIHMRRQDYKSLSLRKTKAFRNSSKEKNIKKSLVPTEDSNQLLGDNEMPPKKKVRFEG
ncbi:ribosome production factor 2 homolog [Oppia nitens]|uniref:ribosome production factor 2 homolog n=1 Tax=Oppia nitens TaxID=1686743 RepID=UPI0023DADC79|nr:ribosome production factor 2 homolog [Oppia nitens]